jgi:hypothetical protein
MTLVLIDCPVDNLYGVQYLNRCCIIYVVNGCVLKMLEQHLLLFCLQAIFFMVLVAWVRKTQNHAHKMLLDALAQRSASASAAVTSSCCHATCQGDRQLPPRDDHEPPAAATSAVSPTSGDGEHNTMKDYIIARNLPVFLWDSSSVSHSIPSLVNVTL